MQNESQISSEVEFDREGKHHGYLRLPHSVHRSAYGWIPIPVISIRNQDGPTVLMLGGNHGDEYEGQIALSQLAQNIEPAEINGQLIILPMANFPAAMAGHRTSPIDQGNLNRSFPGKPLGTPTEMIAHYIESVLLSRSDFLLDVHSGGSSMVYRPTLLMTKSTEETQQKRNLELLSSFGFSTAVLFEANAREKNHTGTYSSSAACRQNAIAITAEIGGAGTVDAVALRQLERGIYNYLAHIGALECKSDQNNGLEEKTRFLEIISENCYVYSRHRGLFEPAVEIGADVTSGQLAGWIHHPDTPMKASDAVYFDLDARVVCKRIPAITERGDCLFELAVPAALP